MNEITESYLQRAEIWVAVCTLLYFLMNGAQVFETAVLVPKWTAAPPTSFSYLTDKNGTSLKTFWIVMHSIHEISFILAIVFCWKIDPVKYWLLLIFVLHMALRVWTIVYFASNIIEFGKIYESGTSMPDLAQKAAQWQTLNYVRVGLYLLLSFGFIPLFIRLFTRTI